MNSKTKTTATKEEATPALVPKLRFPEFLGAGDWEQKYIEDFFNVGSSKRVLQQDWVAQGIPFYRTRELVSLSKNEPFSSEIFISKSLFEEITQKYGAPREGDFLVSGVGTLGISYLVKKGDKFYFKDGNVIWFSRKGGISSSFFKYCFESDVIQDQILKQASVSTVGTYTIQNAKTTKFNCPPKEKEQQKIAECLSSVDELMAAQVRKVDALKTLKKGLMQQLFPREGETQPRLRFPEFQNAGEWKPTSFGALGLDVSDGNYSSKYPSQSDFVANGVPFLRANNLKFGTVSDDDMRFISKEQHCQITKGHLKQGDILVTTRGELGTVALVPDRHVSSNINAQIVRINTGNKLVNTFLFQLLDYSRVIGMFDSLSTGTALKQLPIGKLNQLVLCIPEIREEQQRIASCLSSLDALIAAETQKLEALKTHKKGLMQQLFPSPEPKS